MYISDVEQLKINYKTLEQFQKFVGNSSQELSMLKDLQSDLIENPSDSPFYGIYMSNLLVARMCIYTKTEHTFTIPVYEKYIDLRKFEVLPAYYNKGIGTKMINFAKNFNLPIIAIARVNSHGFFEKQSFIKVKNENDCYYWLP